MCYSLGNIGDIGIKLTDFLCGNCGTREKVYVCGKGLKRKPSEIPLNIQRDYDLFSNSISDIVVQLLQHLNECLLKNAQSIIF